MITCIIPGLYKVDANVFIRVQTLRSEGVQCEHWYRRPGGRKQYVYKPAANAVLLSCLPSTVTWQGA